ncbi:hypothetical protein [Halorubellus litoreus]|uniref:Major facilitator superfamily (MFS) profile domain-containing protein n=1 Tax=Halorubellus litoreus TaxID=755308 RepID=A0ABD5VIY1_9EURY
MATEDRTVTRDDRLPVGRFGRILVLVAFVSASFIVAANAVLSGTLLAIAVVVVGSIAMVTAMVGFLISVASYVDE